MNDINTVKQKIEQGDLSGLLRIKGDFLRKCRPLNKEQKHVYDIIGIYANLHSKLDDIIKEKCHESNEEGVIELNFEYDIFDVFAEVLVMRNSSPGDDLTPEIDELVIQILQSNIKLVDNEN